MTELTHTAMHRLARVLRAARPRRPARGQALVEFGLIFPVFILLVIGMIEFAMAFNANLAINFATREAALIGAESGNDDISDCRILQAIDRSVTTPANADRIEQVRIYRANVNGGEVPGNVNVYQRGGSGTTCTFWDGVAWQVISVPYSLTGAQGYPPDARCNQLPSCGPGQRLDTIGVSITYQHSWVTPLAEVVSLGGSGILFEASNAMRMEPVL